jgi:hypothetical protein
VTHAARHNRRNTVVAFLAGVVVALVPAVALASGGSGDYCSNCALGPSPASYMDPGYHSGISDTESWNTPGNGWGSCTGIYQTSVSLWVAGNCIGNGAGYNEVYCGEGSCYIGTLPGHAIMRNADSAGHYFTGWVQWAS